MVATTMRLFASALVAAIVVAVCSIDAAEAALCSGTETLTGITGNFATSTPWSGEYENNMECTWEVAPVPDDPSDAKKFLEIRFTRFDIEEGYDDVRLYDGNTTDAFLFAIVSGSLFDGNSGSSEAPQSVFYASGRAATVVFSSDVEKNEEGFEAQYRLVSCADTGCSGHGSCDVVDTLRCECDNGWHGMTCATQHCDGMEVMDGTGGRIVHDDSDSESNYEDQAHCGWTFPFEAGTQRLVLNYDLIDLEKGYDFMRIYDGSGSEVGVLSDVIPTPLEFIVCDPDAVVTFISDRYVVSKGFDFTYEIETLPANTTCIPSTITCEDYDQCEPDPYSGFNQGISFATILMVVVFLALILSSCLFVVLMVRRRRVEPENFRAGFIRGDIEAEPLPPIPVETVYEDDADFDDEICIICMDNPVNARYLPCGHGHSCVVCARQLRTCPLCRADLTTIEHRLKESTREDGGGDAKKGKGKKKKKKQKTASSKDGSSSTSSSSTSATVSVADGSNAKGSGSRASAGNTTRATSAATTTTTTTATTTTASPTARPGGGAGANRSDGTDMTDEPADASA